MIANETDFVFALPWPPAALHPNRRPGNWGALAGAKRNYRARCRRIVERAVSGADIESRIGRGTIRVELEFRPPTVRARDEDNLVAAMKAGLDGLADGLCVNDNRFSLAEPAIGDPVKGGAVYCVVKRGDPR